MALLELRDIGKIYVSEGSVAVGIRGVNLSFERGELVAVTGKSGSGKSTLLNVISGMDTYEEGELYIDEQPTSHYLQSDWEEYREKYISFIFQDYNIIESFTVLENVELALMHIDDPTARRRRALELIERVGLTSHLKHKGSRLSGGQKQRTVIARALAKDSPIILADEPTGNLDSKTSKEIIELLREVSKDKLLIIVTHNFEQVEHCATRHVRIFDGAVESDHVISSPERGTEPEMSSPTNDKAVRRSDVSKGFLLGRSIFKAKPRLSFFICMLMIIGTLAIFAVTSFFTADITLFEKQYMFNHINGRLVIAKQNGQVISDEELDELAALCKAESVLHYDKLLDSNRGGSLPFRAMLDNRTSYIDLDCVYNEDLGKPSIGRYPEAPNEVLLYLSISQQEYFGKDELLIDRITLNLMALDVVGVKYFYDNNKSEKCVFTREGFENTTAIYFLLDSSNASATLNFSAANTVGSFVQELSIVPSYEVERGKIYVDNSKFNSLLEQSAVENAIISMICQYYDRTYDYLTHTNKVMTFSRDFSLENVTSARPERIDELYIHSGTHLYVSVSLMKELADEVLEMSYSQASLFFEDDEAARDAVELLRSRGYIAVPSDTTYEPDPLDIIFEVITSVIMIMLWGLAIIFIAFFINLCSSRALSAFKSDMAIMRSMGISVRIIRIGMYVRMFISLIPAFIAMTAAALAIFLSPRLNPYFTFLYAWQYAAIVLGMILLTLRITHKQIRRLFGESVKKALRGGAAE